MGEDTSRETKEVFPARRHCFGDSLKPSPRGLEGLLGAVLGAAVLDQVSRPSSNLHSWGFVSLKIPKSQLDMGFIVF